MDDLISRLRARAADPDRRTTSPRSQLLAKASGLDLGELQSVEGGLFGALRGVVRANRAGQVDWSAFDTAQRLGQRMSTPEVRDLPDPADPPGLEAAEAELGLRLPSTVRRVYLEVADGGFGPGEGLLPLSDVVAAHRELRKGDELPRGRTWPTGLVPLVAGNPGWDCVDATTGRVIAWDPEELSERSSEQRFQASFREIHPSVEAWLAEWVTSRTQAEEHAAMMADMFAAEPALDDAGLEAWFESLREGPDERTSRGDPADRDKP